MRVMSLELMSLTHQCVGTLLHGPVELQIAVSNYPLESTRTVFSRRSKQLFLDFGLRMEFTSLVLEYQLGSVVTNNNMVPQTRRRVH